MSSVLAYSSISCGIHQLVHLSDESPEEIVNHVAHAKHEKNEPFGVLLFSDRAAVKSGGSKLAAFIEKNELGTLQVTGPLRNPNSGNTIKMWTWIPNDKKLKEFMPKKGEDKDAQIAELQKQIDALGPPPPYSYRPKESQAYYAYWSKRNPLDEAMSELEYEGEDPWSDGDYDNFDGGY